MEQATNELVRQHLTDVLRTAFESNQELFKKMKEDGAMNKAVEFVFKEEIEEAKEKGKEETVAAMLADHFPPTRS